MLTTIERARFRQQIEQVKSNYVAFMGDASLPCMELYPMSTDEASKELAWAAVNYDPRCNKYELRVWDQLFHPNVGADCSYILFHEFTHAVDISRYGAKSQDRYNALRGYLEYHAAQVEMIKLLGRRRFSIGESFSVNDIVCTMERKMTVREYLECGLDVVDDRLHRVECEPSIASLFYAVGTLYGHLERISVCEAAATDYDLCSSIMEERCAASELFGATVWRRIRSVFTGIMDEGQVLAGGNLYWGALVDLLQKYGV